MADYDDIYYASIGEQQNTRGHSTFVLSRRVTQS